MNVSSIRGYAGSRIEVEGDAVLGDLAVTGSHVPDGQPVGFRGVVEAMEAGEGVVAVGSVFGSWEGECRRCLGPAVGTISQNVKEIYERDAVDGETYPIEGDLVNLEPLVREAVMLELPEAPLCKPDCQGLCPECGINRNQGTCDCTPDLSDPRWAALDALKSES